MLIPELSMLVAVGALFLTLLNSLFIWGARRDMQKSLFASQQEQRANNLAVYGLARHIRSIQVHLDQPEAKTNDKPNFLEEADLLVDQGIDTLGLADELGVSQNEAEVIAHLRPRRKLFQKTA